MVEIEDLKARLKILLTFYNIFKAFTDSYIIEYFTSCHWDKIPSPWRILLKDFSTSDVAELLLTPNATSKSCKVWPLSLIAFKKCAHFLPISRCQRKPDIVCGYGQKQSSQKSSREKILQLIFRKHVKAKKQHEIYILSKTVSDLLESSNCSSVIDIGSGQGHLARTLSLGFDHPVITLEQNYDFLQKAKKFDQEAVSTILKTVHQSHVKVVPPIHVQSCISVNISADDFISQVEHCVPNQPEKLSKYLLTSLHACGDLSATMVRLYRENPRIEAVVSVACCYMKLTTEDTHHNCSLSGYPMSSYVASLDNHHLSYKAREISCHAIEDYCQRLKGTGPQLKMHCYRAALGTILRKNHPDLIRPPVQTIKKAFNLNFTEYVKLAFSKLRLPQPCKADVQKAETLVEQWVHVVIYFSICLMIGPAVESIILLDRMIYLKENELDCEICPIFNPKLSPRCFAIISKK